MKIKKIILLVVLFTTSSLFAQKGKDVIALTYSPYVGYKAGNVIGIEHRDYMNKYLYSVTRFHYSFYWPKNDFTQGDIIYKMRGFSSKSQLSLGLGFNYTFFKRHNLFIEEGFGLVYVDASYTNVSLDNHSTYLLSYTAYNQKKKGTGYSRIFSLGYEYNVWDNLSVGIAYMRTKDFYEARNLFNFRVSYAL